MLCGNKPRNSATRCNIYIGLWVICSFTVRTWSLEKECNSTIPLHSCECCNLTDYPLSHIGQWEGWYEFLAWVCVWVLSFSFCSGTWSTRRLPGYFTIKSTTFGWVSMWDTVHNDNELRLRACTIDANSVFTTYFLDKEKGRQTDILAHWSLHSDSDM